MGADPPNAPLLPLNSRIYPLLTGKLWGHFTGDCPDLSVPTCVILSIRCRALPLPGLGFRVLGFGVRVNGLGFRV
jgi:hypothetical protein